MGEGPRSGRPWKAVKAELLVRERQGFVVAAS